MANRNTQGFGLVAAGTLGSTPATSGQGKYKIDAGYNTTIYNGGAVASVKRSSNVRSGRTVRLTSSQVAIAKKLGVPLEEYAKQIKITEGA
jgi:hypothetical protein